MDAQTLIVQCIDVIENAVRRPPPTAKGVIKIALHSVEVSLEIGGETEVWVMKIWMTQNLWLWNGTVSIIFRYHVDFRISIRGGHRSSWTERNAVANG